MKFSELIFGLAAATGIIAAVIIGCVTPAYFMDRWDCASYEEVTSRETKYQGLSCYVMDDYGKWRSMDEMKIRNAAKGE